MVKFSLVFAAALFAVPSFSHAQHLGPTEYVLPSLDQSNHNRERLEDQARNHGDKWAAGILQKMDAGLMTEDGCLVAPAAQLKIVQPNPANELIKAKQEIRYLKRQYLKLLLRIEELQNQQDKGA